MSEPRMTPTIEELKAREWAVTVLHYDEHVRATAEVIRDLPDTIVDGDKLREVIERWSIEPLTSETAPYMVEQLRELLPTPPTMAETEWNNDTHAGLVARHKHGQMVRMLLPSSVHMLITCVNEDGKVENYYPSDLTPLEGTKIDLAPYTPTDWHEGGKRSPFYAAARAEIDRLNQRGGEYAPGGVLEGQTASPHPEDVPVGEPWQVEVEGQAAIGYRNDPGDRLCWAVVLQDESGHEWMYDDDVTLVARLVPETTELEELREELEALRDTLAETKIEFVRGEYEYGQHTAFLMASSRITRILEGE